jgi:uncharacterized protein YyaL (SSP411 family)
LSSNLIDEVSLYLQEYNDTLVNWHRWNKKALTIARNEKKPIFLSIGYSGSLLCKRMKNDSFNDKEIAKILNENFISIKVDKDERVDIDKYYKQVYRLMNGQNGSSPLSIFMSENLEPFYSVAYIPKNTMGNLIGFKELLEIIIDKYKNDKLTLIKKGKEILSHLNYKNNKIEATKFNKNIIDTLDKHFNELFDNQYGGFGNMPKFLNISLIDLMFEYYRVSGNRDILEKALFTLRKIAKGEIYDSNRGGFYRYANEKNWNRPRLEKIGLDNGNIAYLYIKAYKITKDSFFQQIAFKTIDFMLKEMSKDSLFFSNLVENQDGSIFKDTKVITSSNAMIIDTIFSASTIDNSYLSTAIKHIDRVLDEYYINGELYHTKNIKAFLEDYAYLGVALLKAYKITDNQEYLIISQTLLNRAIERFYEYGRWRFSISDIEVYDDIYDLSYPSSISTILYLIEKISPLIEGDYRDILFKTLEMHSYNLMRQPLSSPKMTKVLLLYLEHGIILEN